MAAILISGVRGVLSSVCRYGVSLKKKKKISLLNLAQYLVDNFKLIFLLSFFIAMDIYKNISLDLLSLNLDRQDRIVSKDASPQNSKNLMSNKLCSQSKIKKKLI